MSVSRLSYQELDELVRRYKEGDQKALEQLLQQFHPLFSKYARLIKGDPSQQLYNFDTFQFLGLLTASPDRQSPTTRATIQRLQQLTQHLSHEDVYQEIVCCFLECLAQYRFYDNVGSLGYIITRLRWEIKDWLNSLAALSRTPPQPIISLTQPDGSQMDIEEEEYEEQPGSYPGMSEMTLGWVLHTKDPLFAELSIYQRYLLYLHFKENLGLRAMSRVLRRNKDTVRLHLHETLTQLRQRARQTQPREAEAGAAGP